MIIDFKFLNFFLQTQQGIFGNVLYLFYTMSIFLYKFVKL